MKKTSSDQLGCVRLYTLNGPRDGRSDYSRMTITHQGPKKQLLIHLVSGSEKSVKPGDP